MKTQEITSRKLQLEKVLKLAQTLKSEITEELAKTVPTLPLSSSKPQAQQKINIEKVKQLRAELELLIKLCPENIELRKNFSTLSKFL